MHSPETDVDEIDLGKIDLECASAVAAVCMLYVRMMCGLVVEEHS